MGTITWAAVIGGIVGGAIDIWAQAFIPGACIFLAACCGAGIAFCNWWLHIRLICLGGNRSVVGAIYNVEPPTPSFGVWNLGDYDTDYSFNLLLYGATPADLLPNCYVNQFPLTSPVTKWSAAPYTKLQSDWSTLFPYISWEDGNLILPQLSMGPLGLGYTGQSDIPGPTLGPLQSITINPSDVAAPNGSTVEFQAIGYDPAGQSQDLTGSVDWTTTPTSPSSVTYATITSGSSTGDPNPGLATAASTGSGTTNIVATDSSSGVSGSVQMTTTSGGTPVITGIGPVEQMLLHCEIEGPGMHDFRTMLYWLLGIFATAGAVSFIPVVGTVISWILVLIAFLIALFGGPVIQHDTASPPDPGSDDGWGGFAYVDATSPTSMVDIMYVMGRWVFDSLHQPSGSNEIHPALCVNKINCVSQADLSYGNWPSNMESAKVAYDVAYAQIFSPSTPDIQSRAEFQWSLHPLLDGCKGQMSYAPPTSPPAPK